MLYHNSILMRPRNSELSQHSRKILELLQKQEKPLTAYEILGRLHKCGIKAPTTVYRALNMLVKRGLAHRIESLNAFTACHGGEAAHVAHFAVCRNCHAAIEIHDDRLGKLIREMAQRLQFQVERDVLELLGLCRDCAAKEA